MSLPVELSQEMRKRILTIKETDEERLNQDIMQMKSWLKKMPHLPQDLSDELIQSFIICCKGVEEAKVRLDRYFTIRNFATEFYSDRDPLGFYTPDPVQQFFLPGYCQDGSLVYILRIPEGTDIKSYHSETVSKRQILLMDFIIDRGILNAGVLIVYDLAGMSVSFLKSFNLSLLTSSNKAFEDNYPVHISKLILHNCNSFLVNTYDSLVKPLMKKKIAVKVVLTKSGDRDTLKEYIPDEILPSDMGGSGQTCQQLHESYVKLLEDERDWCLDTERQRSEESRRITRTRFDFQQQHGIDGHFRTLSID